MLMMQVIMHSGIKYRVEIIRAGQSFMHITFEDNQQKLIDPNGIKEIKIMTDSDHKT